MKVLIAVTAIDHPELDDWVWERAEEEAFMQGMKLRHYMGLVDERESTGFYYHQFLAQREY